MRYISPYPYYVSTDLMYDHACALTIVSHDQMMVLMAEETVHTIPAKQDPSSTARDLAAEHFAWNFYNGISTVPFIK